MLDRRSLERCGLHGGGGFHHERVEDSFHFLRNRPVLEEGGVPGVELNVRIETGIMGHLRPIRWFRLATKLNARRILGKDGTSAIRLLLRCSKQTQRLV